MSNLKLKDTSYAGLVKTYEEKGNYQFSIGHNTFAWLTKTDGGMVFRIYYHGNNIATITPQSVTLTNAGWGTPTTRNRLSIIARQNGVPLGFGQKNFEQTIIDHTDTWGVHDVYPFLGTVKFDKTDRTWKQF
jgi:hypothetical protein